MEHGDQQGEESGRNAETREQEMEEAQHLGEDQDGSNKEEHLLNTALGEEEVHDVTDNITDEL